VIVVKLDVETIRKYIEERGLTQSQFASLTGLTQGMVSRLLDGQLSRGMVVAERVLRAMPVELWPELLVFSDGRSVFQEYEERKKQAGFSTSA